MGADPVTETPETTDAPATEQPPVDATGEPNGGNPAEQPISFASRDELDAYITESLKERLAREEKKRKDAEEKAARKGAEEALAKNEQFKELAETRAQTILELESKVGTLDQLEAERDELTGVLNEFLQKEREGIPAHVTALLDELSPVKQLRYIAANRASFSQKTNGVPATPKADHDSQLSLEQRREKPYFKPRF
jgi:hypothetical protein